MKITVDASDALSVAADLGRAAAELVSRVKPAVADASTGARDAMRADMAGSSSFGHAANSITFDQRGLTSEIGPTKPAGAIANIAYFGGSNGGGGTVRDPQEAAESADVEGIFNGILDGLL